MLFAACCMGWLRDRKARKRADILGQEVVDAIKRAELVMGLELALPEFSRLAELGFDQLAARSSLIR